MLVEKSNIPNKSSYVCDMCRSSINRSTKVAIYISKETESPKKKWDLCKKCYNIVNKNINLWYNRIEKNKIEK